MILITWSENHISMIYYLLCYICTYVCVLQTNIYIYIYTGTTKFKNIHVQKYTKVSFEIQNFRHFHWFWNALSNVLMSLLVRSRKIFNWFLTIQHLLHPPFLKKYIIRQLFMIYSMSWLKYDAGWKGGSGAEKTGKKKDRFFPAVVCFWVRSDQMMSFKLNNTILILNKNFSQY